MASGTVKKLGRIAAWTMVGLLIVLACAITATIGWRPIIGPRARKLTNRTFERTPARLARGKYLVEGVGGCLDCHSEYTGEPKAGEVPNFVNRGAGRLFINEGNLVIAAPNITPDVETGVGSWTDDQLARAIREGIDDDNETLFPAMPYEDFRKMTDEDIASVVVFLRSLPAIRHQLPERKVPFPLSRLINSVPEPVTEPVLDSGNDPVSRGKYLVRMAHCASCHTPHNDHGQPLPGMDFAGGEKIEAFKAATANITPDPTGISYYDEALFLKTLRTGAVGARPLNIPMPWWTFRNMTDDDLKSIFAFLRTVKPVHHSVDNTEVATFCKRCKHTHGLGDHNQEEVARK